jgi:tRNA(Ile)-lysidine synthase
MGAQKQGAHKPQHGNDGQPRTAPAPVSTDQFHDLMLASLPQSVDGPIAVAVSGGADSMALCLLAADWAKALGRPLTALTVDHGIRPTAGAEALQVQDWLADRDIEHQTLTVADAAPQSNLQAWAREARYALMEDWCAAHQAQALLLAHHLEDQAETLMLRLGRGSGVDGLSAMASQIAPRFEGGPWRIRPLLDVPKARLLDTLDLASQDWIEDPTNQDTRYARNRLRQMRQSLSDIGLTPQRLAKTAKTMRRAKEALDDATQHLKDRALQVHETGYCTLDMAAFRTVPDDVQLRLLGRLLAAFGGQEYGPRAGRLEALLVCILEGNLGGGRTLSGCRIVPDKGQFDRIVICRESRSVADTINLNAGKPCNWDRRYRVCVHEPHADQLTIGRLGAGGWSAIRKIDQSLLKNTPRMAGINVPALRRGDELVCVPTLDYRAEGADIAVDIEFTALRRL